MLSEEDQVSFFTNIRNGKVKAVGDFIDGNKESAPFNNEVGESAAAVALKSRQLAIYEVLISRAWFFNSNENFSEIVTNSRNILTIELRELNEKFTQNPNDLTSLIDAFLDRNRYILPNNYEEGKSAAAMDFARLISLGGRNVNVVAQRFESAFKNELREIHKKNGIKNPSEEHVITLITRAKIFFGGNLATINRRDYLELIAGAYQELNKILEIRAILKVVANVKKLNVIFDFNRDSIDHADPTGNPNVQGTTYAVTGEVYIGAKGLNDANRSEVLGAIAHELCHFAIFHIYNNDFKPYHKEDSKGEQDFISVNDNCWGKSGIENYIDVVLNGPKDKKHSELIVRVPHLLALYQGDIVRIDFLKETFQKLFDYFERRTLPDLEKEIKLMSAVWKLKSKEPQYLTDSKINIKITDERKQNDLNSNKVIEISSNCPQITMCVTKEMLSKSNDHFIFLVLSHLKEGKTLDLLLDAHSSCMKPTIVIDCDNETEQLIVKNAEDLKKDKITERLIFIHNYKESLIKDAISLPAYHSWLHLMDESKKNLIKKMIHFQREKIVLEEIVDLHCDALERIPLKELLDNYLKIDNEFKFSEIDIHVQRKFLNNNSEEIEPKQLLNIAETSKVILLSDDPGMGKTTELKMLSLELKKKLKSSWVAFVDLKEHFKAYEKDEQFKTIFISSEEISNFFAKKIFELNEFEERVFKNLFSGNRVVLLLDGFDEISPSFKKFITMLIKSIKENSKNILIISTRPQLKEKICEELEVEAYTLMPLTMEKCEEILKKSFEKLEFSGEELKKKIDFAKDFLINSTQNYEPLKNPLILTMVAKVLSKGQFSENKQANIFSIYENFVSTMVNGLKDKGPDAAEEVMIYNTSELHIYLIHYKEAFNVLFDYEKNIKKRKNIDLCFKDVQSLPDDKLSKIGLMKYDDSGKIQFIHRTYAEFFVADFLFKNVFDLKVLKEQKSQINEERMKAVFEILKEVFHCGWSETVRSFIDGALESLIPNIKVIEKEVLFSTFTNFLPKDKLPEKFYNFVGESLINIITIITQCADKDEQKRIWDFDDFTYTHFMTAARVGSLDFNKKFIALARKVLDEKNLQKEITKKNFRRVSAILLASLNNDRKVIQFYINLLPLPRDLFQHSRIYCETDDRLYLKLLSANISGLKTIFEQVSRYGYFDFNLTRFLNAWTIHDDTFYVFACISAKLSIEQFEEFWKLLRNFLNEKDFKTLLKKPDSHGSTPLMIKAQLKNKVIFTSFWELLTEDLTDEEKKKFLIEKNENGESLYEFASKNQDPETFIAVKNLYKSMALELFME